MSTDERTKPFLQAAQRHAEDAWMLVYACASALHDNTELPSRLLHHIPNLLPCLEFREWLTTNACDGSPSVISKLFCSDVSVVRRYCADPGRVVAWFDCFHSIHGVCHFRGGSPALAAYALAARDRVWHLLRWRHRPRSPVTLASKRHYFAELDVAASIASLLEHAPDFLASPDLQHACASPEWTTSAPHFFAEVLLERLGPRDSAHTDQQGSYAKGSRARQDDDFCAGATSTKEALASKLLNALLNSRPQRSLVASCLSFLEPEERCSCLSRCLKQGLLRNQLNGLFGYAKSSRNPVVDPAGAAAIVDVLLFGVVDWTRPAALLFVAMCLCRPDDVMHGWLDANADTGHACCGALELSTAASSGEKATRRSHEGRAGDGGASCGQLAMQGGADASKSAAQQDTAGADSINPLTEQFLVEELARGVTWLRRLKRLAESGAAVAVSDELHGRASILGWSLLPCKDTANAVVTRRSEVAMANVSQEALVRDRFGRSEGGHFGVSPVDSGADDSDEDPLALMKRMSKRGRKHRGKHKHKSKRKRRHVDECVDAAPHSPPRSTAGLDRIDVPAQQPLPQPSSSADPTRDPSTSTTIKASASQPEAVLQAVSTELDSAGQSAQAPRRPIIGLGGCAAVVHGKPHELDGRTLEQCLMAARALEALVQVEAIGGNAVS